MSLLLSKQEKDVIWNALWFSNRTYKRRENKEGAAQVQEVMNSVGKILGVKERLYTEAEFNEIIEVVSKKNANTLSILTTSAFHRGVAKGKKEILQSLESVQRYAEAIKPIRYSAVKGSTHDLNSSFPVGSILSREQCEECETKKDCAVYNLVFGDEEEESKEEGKETIKSEEKAVPQSPKEASKHSNAADDGVNYEQD